MYAIYWALLSQDSITMGMIWSRFWNLWKIRLTEVSIFLWTKSTRQYTRTTLPTLISSHHGYLMLWMRLGYSVSWLGEWSTRLYELFAGRARFRLYRHVLGTGKKIITESQAMGRKVEVDRLDGGKRGRDTVHQVLSRIWACALSYLSFVWNLDMCYPHQ